MSETPVISVNGLTVRYGNQTVLSDITLSINRGDFLGVIGPNGGGKSTLIKTILGLVSSDAGAVKLFGVPVGNFREWHRVGYVKQRMTSQLPRFPITVGEVVAMAMPGSSHIFRNAASTDRVLSALEAVGMRKHAANRLDTLSGGQLQRVFIAKALIADPELLILDEPTVGVDAATQEQFYSLLRNLNTAMKLTLILVSHDIDVVANEVSRLACLNRTLTYCGIPKSFLTDNYLKTLYGKNVKFILHGH